MNSRRRGTLGAILEAGSWHHGDAFSCYFCFCYNVIGISAAIFVINNSGLSWLHPIKERKNLRWAKSAPWAFRIGIQRGWSMTLENWTLYDARTGSVSAWESEKASLQREKEEADVQRVACWVGSAHSFPLQVLSKASFTPASSVWANSGPFQNYVLTSPCLFFLQI